MGTTKPDPETERDKVYDWNLKVLLDVGLPLEDATKLVEAKVDIHRAVDLARKGCAPRLVVEILT